MNRRHLIAAAALPLMLATGAAAAPVAKAATKRRTVSGAPGEVGRIAKAFVASGYAPGLAVAAMRDQRLLFAQGFGLANLEDSVPVTAESVFRAGSISKQFVAAAIMRLAEAGKIDLDAPAATYVPEMAAAGPITVRMLLHQMSGLHNYSGREFNQRLDRTPKQMLDYILAQPKLMDFAPGERFEYSNSNYFVLGVMVERVGGRPLKAALDDLIQAAGLAQTEADSSSDVVPHRAEGYSLIGGKPGQWKRANYLSMDNAGGAGVLRSTPADLVKWHQALFAGRVVSQANLDRMLETGKLNSGQPVLRDDPPIAEGHPAYGFGLEVGSFAGHRAIGHGGSVSGYTAYIVTFPDQQLSASIMINTDPNRQMPFAPILHAVLGETSAA